MFGSYYAAIRHVSQGIGDQERVTSDFFNLLISQILSVTLFCYVSYQFLAHLLIQGHCISVNLNHSASWSGRLNDGVTISS